MLVGEAVPVPLRLLLLFVVGVVPPPAVAPLTSRLVAVAVVVGFVVCHCRKSREDAVDGCCCCQIAELVTLNPKRPSL